MIDLATLAILIGYVVATRGLSRLPQGLADVFLAVLNLSVAAWICFKGEALPYFFVYVGLVGVEFLFIRECQNSRVRYWVGLWFPIAVLVAIKYLPSQLVDGLVALHIPVSSRMPTYFVGLSYMAFRLTLLAVEINTQATPKISLARYLSFAFFLPTLVVGPISSFRTFDASRAEATTPTFKRDFVSGAVRIIFGATKYFFLASILNQLTFDGLLKAGTRQVAIDWLVAGAAYYLYLYCNFSGFCDIAIGGARLMGIRVAENFDAPYLARNMQEFWNRWHMTLSQYMRQMVFTPLSKALIGRFGTTSTRQHLCMVGTISITFVLTGVWHGRGMQYLLFGIVHALGVSVTYLYGVLLKRWLGKKGAKQYLQRTSILWMARGATFIYASFAFAFFVNPPRVLIDLLKRTQWF
ncbi:MAG: MBOAT family protein [Deltaproteobacteria bacterium]|nr:MBOAT family protein [Deltaproteobacteria bacterium]